MPPRKSKKVEQGQGAGMGRALVKSKQQHRRAGRKYASQQQEEAVNITAAKIAQDATVGLQSVLEQNDLTKLLTNADLVQREFTAERLTAELKLEYETETRLFNPDGTDYDLSRNKVKLTDEELSYYIDRLVCIPRRPNWNDGGCDTAEEFQREEKIAFHDWLARLKMFEQDTGMFLTPFERNIDVWRQLWRVLERSHVVIQIVDSRNPLLYHSKDLDRYVEEIGDGTKKTLLLMNKADLLSPEQRKLWYEYFKKKNVNVWFFSALEGASDVKPAPYSRQRRETDTSVVSNTANDELDEKKTVGNKFENLTVEDEGEKEEERVEKLDETTEEKPCEDDTENADSDDELQQRKVPQLSTENKELEDDGPHPWDILDTDNLITELETYCEAHFGGTLYKTQKYFVGLCGFPNVGKSSTLNSLTGSKKSAVSATPGRTKHFQTMHLTDKLVLCDSPGLVMPTLAKSHAQLVINGVLPIDQMRDPLEPVKLIYSRIPHRTLESVYGVSLPESFTAAEFLSSVAFQRGFMSGASGRPDSSRAARIVIRHYTTGKLLYCIPPPGYDAEEYRKLSPVTAIDESVPIKESKRQLANRVFVKRSGINLEGEEATLDREFFSGAHTIGVRNGKTSPLDLKKPWKKHFNSGKREKLRRVYAHLEQ